MLLCHLIGVVIVRQRYLVVIPFRVALDTAHVIRLHMHVSDSEDNASPLSTPRNHDGELSAY